MKMGFRTPSIKKSISARTTGRATRALKSCYTPTYGKRGTGKYKNPKKSAYNKVYHETTVGATENIKKIVPTTYRTKRISRINNYNKTVSDKNQYKGAIRADRVAGILAVIITILIFAFFGGLFLYMLKYFIEI